MKIKVRETVKDLDYDAEVEAMKAITPATHPGYDAVHTRRITAAQNDIDAAESELVSAVAAARKAGDSWVRIGAALGVSRQAAFARFHTRVEELTTH